MCNIFTYWHDLKEIPPYIQWCVRNMERIFGAKFTLYERESFIRDFPEVRRDIWDFYHSKGNDIHQHAMRSDYLRAHMLYKYGGFWLDADTIVVRDFTKDIGGMFDDGVDYIARRNEVGWAAMNFMGSSPKGRVIRELIRLQDSVLDTQESVDAGSKFGSRLLTQAIESVKVGVPIFTVNEHLICPINFKNAWKYFESAELIGGFDLDEVWCFQLFNRGFNDSVRKMSMDELMEQDWLLSEMFRALDKEGCCNDASN